MGTITWDDTPEAGGSVTWDQPVPAPVPVKLGQEGFKDAMMQTLQDQPWLGRNVASMGLQLSKAWQGLTGGNDQAQIQGADVAAQEAPVGAIAGDVVKYAPAALAATAASPVLLPALAAGAIGAATTPGDTLTRLKAAAIDAAGGYGAGKAIQGVAWGAKALGNTSSLSAARKALEDIIGTNNMPEALRLARAAPADISAEQALVGLNNPNVANLAKITHGLSPEAAAEYAALQARQQAAREAAIQGVTPDLAAAEAARTAATKPLYQQADTAVAQLDAPFMDLFNRLPKGTLEAADNIARMEGKTFMVGKYAPAQSVPTGLLDAAGQPIMRTIPAQFPKMTGESLHYIKRALSDISNAVDPARGIGRDAQDAARGVLSDFLPAFEAKIPAYGQARATFAAESAPVNQSKVLSAMTDKLQTSVGRESPAAFLNVMGAGEQAMLKKSTGFPRYDSVADVLNPNQMNVVSNVADELQRNATLAAHRASEGSHQAVVDAVARKTWHIPNILSRPAMIANAALKQGETAANKAMMTRLETAMRNPAQLADLLGTLPIEQRNVAVKFLNNLSLSGAPAVAGGTVADLMQ